MTESHAWYKCDQVHPLDAGIYEVITSKLYQGPMKFNGSKWHLKQSNDHVVWWRQNDTLPS